MSEKKHKDWKKFQEEALTKEEQEVDELLDEEDEELEPEEGALEHPSYASLEEKLTLAEQKAHENWEKSVRAMAELDNVRRRAEREVSNAHRYGLERFVSSLLPVIDSLEQALQVAEKQDDSNMQEGLELTMKLFLDVLQRFDIKQINPEGEAFNPQLHEAMSMQEIPGVEANTIVNVFQKGYTLNDRVIRPARVIVAKGN
ncbi:Heat-shock protein GrpE(HSP-70 cofactor) (plasmid) [Legionella adelaidensis]|uniref:Protein GrpE n=1 Tax=Legionella adelaidensis TaxID=45056 RepID=A0A0W0R509_9GAMM|nr:nucleotide exchange factor GrpE [Legionella adelaidensis]KTC66121.1 Heat-shock protein GrpE(HSP-70 cofactor) [Legionella adelaidensis]VEH85809.1 Heat-shock protein GrpE(HSP-70 cofactor) [Legionella adelaidensis]